jgi:xanthine dehydrogenase accessory factor
MTCHSGGSVEIYLEPVLPAPRLAVFGASPIARALVEMGTALGYTAVTFDPGAGAMAASSSRETFAVVATMGEGDEEAVAAALALQPSYLGVVASAKRFAQMRTTLEAQGVSPATLDGVRSPAGLDLGARTAEEIALSVLAEIVQRRRRAEAGRADAELAAAPAAAQAIDPICGMTVEVASARHVAEHEGRTYHFCGAGCRQRFLAAPAVWIPAGETR